MAHVVENLFLLSEGLGGIPGALVDIHFGDMHFDAGFPGVIQEGFEFIQIRRPELWHFPVHFGSDCVDRGACRFESLHQ